MIWIGLLAGIVVGFAFNGLEGAVVFGFVGWLGGVIAKSTLEVQWRSSPATNRGPSCGSR